jgi:hypothetical protein
VAIRNDLCGCEVWVVTSKDKSGLEAAKILWFLRAVIGIIDDKIKNSRNEPCMKSLNVTVNKCRENWKSQVQHSTGNMITRRMVHYQF